jgi:3-isopropylmalate/(R)-2-methylmalate dehydratase small subunit
MQPFTTLAGRAAPLPQANIDTDVIIRIERLTAGDPASLGRYAFEALRYLPNGADNPAFPFNQPRYRGAPILIAGPNFGCGSSREGAVTAIMGLGVRCVIADSFGDIFYGNCFQNGVLAIRLPAADAARAMVQASELDGDFNIDLAAQTVTTPAGEVIHFPIDPPRRESLLEGLDDIGLSVRQMEAIRAWQGADRQSRPWVWDIDPAQSLTPETA